MSPSSPRGRPGRTRPPAGAPPAGATPPAAQPEAGAGPFPGASPQARRLAAAILEVLAGTQLPSDAARGLGLSLARYYQLELRAVAGLVAACEGRRGRGAAPGHDLAGLRRECERLRRECARQQALVRAARRAVGLAPAAAAPAPAEGRKRRRPTARALKMAALLQPPEGAPAAPAAAAECPAAPGEAPGPP
jgi:hypothetical protein